MTFFSLQSFEKKWIKWAYEKKAILHHIPNIIGLYFFLIFSTNKINP